MEQQVKLAAKLYDCRNSCMKLFGTDWKKQIEFHTKLIHAAMKKHHIDTEIEAAMKLIEDCQHMDGAGVFAMKVLAAAVEIVEPSL